MPERIVQPRVSEYTFFSLQSAGIESGAVSSARFQPGLLRPSPAGPGLSYSTKTSRFVHKVRTG